MNIYFDAEFTGLHQKTTLISLAIVPETGPYFYAEFTDYDRNQIDDWLQDHVLDNLTLTEKPIVEPIQFDKHTSVKGEEVNIINICGDTKTITKYLTEYLRMLCTRSASPGSRTLYFVSDCLAYDFVLFCELFGGAMKLPKFVYYIPFDICTTMKDQGIDPDINREKFAGIDAPAAKHNSLWDAEIIQICYDKLKEGY